jgi:hypothetical protein
MTLSKIKTSLMLKGISLCLLILPASAISQVSQFNLNPDSVFHGPSGDDMMWKPNGTVTIGAQGINFLIKYNIVEYLVYVYTIDHAGKLASYKMGSNGHSYLMHGFPQEGNYYNGFQGNSIAFMFNGQLWHYINQMAYGTILNPAKDSYDCFARIPTPNTKEPRAYYDLITGAPSVIKKGAFQHDSTLYFLGTYAKSSDPNYKKWCLQRYTYNGAQDKFIYNTTILVTNIPGDNFGGCIEHVDDYGQHSLILNTYNRSTGDISLGWLNEYSSGSESYWAYVEEPVVTNGSASVLLGGSLKGCRTIDQVIYPFLPERFTIFVVHGGHTMTYHEYFFQEPAGFMAKANEGSIVLASSLAPYAVDNVYYLQGALELLPTKFHASVQQLPDGFRQQNWVYYADQSARICGAKFSSDSWQYLPGETVSTYDLVDDNIYGPEVRSMWTLVGILDGGPPCSIDWHVWDANHNSLQKPTHLKFTQTTLSKTEITTTHEDQYTIGANFKTDFENFNFGLETKFSDAYKNTVSKSTTIKNEITKTYELNEEGQELGYYYYSVPSMTRYTYRVYPWWDEGLDYPVPNSDQFRFVTTGVTLVDRHHEISSFPFLVNEPNAVDMAGWKHSGRPFHDQAIMDSHLDPACQTNSWKSPQPGTSSTFEELTDSTTEYEHKISYSVEASFSGKKPDIFEIEGSAGVEVSYSTSTKNETEIGTLLEVNLETLTERSLGVNFGEYSVDTYWFRPEDWDWWFYDSLGDQRPWYIAYMVNYNLGKLNLLSPVADEKIQGGGKWFSWSATGFKPAEFQLFILKSPHISPSSILMRYCTGVSTEFYVPDLPSDPEKLYWKITAVTNEGDMVRSEARSLIVGKEEVQESHNNTLTAVPYPNPSNRKGIHLYVETKEKGEMLVRFYSIDGSLVYQSVMNHASEGAHTYELSQLNLSRGFYIMEVIINKEYAVKKLTVLE